MKTFAAVAMVLTLTSCAAFQTKETRATNIRTLCYAAASLGTSEALRQKPEWRGQFANAYSELDSLVKAKTVTGTFLHDLVASLPVKELKSDTARIAIESATLLFDQVAGTKVNIEAEPYVYAAAIGIRDGMRIALGL